MKRALLIIASLCLSGCFFARLYTTDWPQPVESLKVHTSDGWTLDLRHVSPGGSARSHPLVLMHGLVANGRNMDLDDKHSIARDLARRGFDVWIPSLRNVGDSEHRWLPGLRPDESNFDAYVQRDLPAILAEVHARTGAADVDYVGHSMGGIILYAYLARGGKGIARAATLGSPVAFQFSGRWDDLIRSAHGFAPAMSFLPVHASMAMASPFMPGDGWLPERMLMTPENVTPQVWRELLAMSVDDLPSALLMQFASWHEHGNFDSADHSVDYMAGLRGANVPVLVMAGKVDGIAPPWAVRPAFDALASPEKRWLVLGEGNGQARDYNHMDMVIGERMDGEVVAQIAEFLGK